MTIVFQKSILKSKAAKRIIADAKLTYFKEKVLEHLDRLERKEKKREQAVQKSLIEAECLRKAAYPVGTIREWKGKKYIKTAPGKWRRKYDSDSRGAKLSIAAIKRKVDKCESVEELLQVAKQNKHRFTDENGRYLPFVKEMFDYVGKKHKEIKGAKAGAEAFAKLTPKEFLDKYMGEAYDIDEIRDGINKYAKNKELCERKVRKFFKLSRKLQATHIRLHPQTKKKGMLELYKRADDLSRQLKSPKLANFASMIGDYLRAYYWIDTAKEGGAKASAVKAR